MGTLTKLRWLVFHAVNGIYSGIPSCCVAYFCAFNWSHHHLPCGKTTDERRVGRWPDPNHVVEYVQCDRCYAHKRAAKLKFNGSVLMWLPPV